jgi:hypothetical protein
MILKKLLLSTLAITAITVSSCSNDDNLTQNPAYNVPTTYTFERNSTTTVDFSGQSRLLMLGRNGNYIKIAATNGTNVNLSVLTNMYSNTNNAFTDVTLNTWETTKDKTAASKDYFQLFLSGTTTEKVAVQSFLKHNYL